MGCEQESPTGVHLDSEVGRVKRMHLCIEGSIKISYREIEMFHLPSYSIALITKLNVCKVANGTATGSNRSVYLVLLSRWLTNKVMILHSSSSKIAKKVWILCSYSG